MRIPEIRKDWKANWVLYAMILPVLVFVFLFNYIPMAGILMSFERFSPKLGVFGSQWIWFQNFKDFFTSYYFGRLLRNTFLLSFYDLVFAFPIPIAFALLLNEVRNKPFKKAVQTISYMPFFISMVVVAGLLIDFLSSTGGLTAIIGKLGGPTGNLLGMPGAFRPIYVLSNIWQGFGFGSIIYMAALTGIDEQLYEAAEIDGAGRWKQTLHITLPSLANTVVIMLILRMGSLMSVSFEKVLLLYSQSTYSTADVISTFVYRKGLLEANYGYSTAVGLFNSLLNLGFLVGANALSRKFSSTSLF